MKPVDWRAYAYCDDCGTSIDFYRTDLKTFEESREAVNAYLTKILDRYVNTEACGPREIIMKECTIYKSMQIIQEIMLGMQEQGKETNVDQKDSQTYIIDNDKCALDLIIDGNIWYSIISGPGWTRTEHGDPFSMEIVGKEEEDVKQSFIDSAISLIFGRK